MDNHQDSDYNRSRHSLEEKSAMLYRLLSCCDIDLEKGLITWRKHLQTEYLGKPVGKIHHKGYLTVSLTGPKGSWGVSLHRVLWFYHTDKHPECVDHINSDKLDNRLENLRGCSYAQNAWNSTRRRGSVSKVRGVQWVKKKNSYRWEAHMKLAGVVKHVSRHRFFIEAVECRYALEREYLKDFAPDDHLSGEELKILDAEHLKNIEGYAGIQVPYITPRRLDVPQSGVGSVTWGGASWKAYCKVRGSRVKKAGFKTVDEAVEWLEATRAERDA